MYILYVLYVLQMSAFDLLHFLFLAATNTAIFYANFLHTKSLTNTTIGKEATS